MNKFMKVFLVMLAFSIIPIILVGCVRNNVQWTTTQLENGDCADTLYFALSNSANDNVVEIRRHKASGEFSYSVRRAIFYIDGNLSSFATHPHNSNDPFQIISLNHTNSVGYSGAQMVTQDRVTTQNVDGRTRITIDNTIPEGYIGIWFGISVTHDLIVYFYYWTEGMSFEENPIVFVFHFELARGNF